MRFGGLTALDERVARRRRRRGRRRHRPQRRRQDDALQRHLRLRAPRRGHGALARRSRWRACARTTSRSWGSRARCRPSACSTGSRALENVMVGAERRRRAGITTALLGLPWSDKRRARAARAGARRARRARRGRRRRPAAAGRCPTASRSASRWPARWSPSPSCCCSTSRPAGSARDDMAELGERIRALRERMTRGAGRAPHGPRDGGLRPRRRARLRPPDRDRHARPRSRPTRGCSTPTSGSRWRCCELRTCRRLRPGAGAGRRLLRGARGEHHRRPRRQRRRQDDRCCARCRPGARRRRAASCSTARDIGGARRRAIVRLGMAHVPEGRGVIAELTVEENLRLGGAVARAQRREAARRGLRAVPARSRSARTQPAQHAVGRRAPDARRSAAR